MGDGEGSWAMEGSPGEELGGEEARDCDWALKGTAAGKVLLRRVAWACVEAIWGGKGAWAGLASDLTEKFRNSEASAMDQALCQVPR